jgi:hypothetical protein
MADLSTSPPVSWHYFLTFAVLLYRGAMAILLSAFHALPSLQRRRLLEEEAIADPRLTRLLGRPRVLGMGLEFWNQLLLLVLVVLVWPLH